MMPSRLKTLLRSLRPFSGEPGNERKQGYRCTADLRVDQALELAPSAAAPLEIDGISFPRIVLTPRRDTAIGASADGSKVVKIELVHNPRKRNDLLEESRLMQVLASRGSRTCPLVYSTGRIAATDPGLPAEAVKQAGDAGTAQLNYSIRQAISTAKEFPLADPLLALIEQKALGVFNGDFKPGNIRVEPHSGVPFIIDFDQALELDSSVRSLGNRAFLDWCKAQEREKYGHDSMWRHFPGLTYDQHVAPLFRNDAFDLGETTLGRSQNTTRAVGGIYHQLDDPRIYTVGVRDFAERATLLQTMDWRPGERVLDVGCNLGLLSFWLADHGCVVTGIDLDPAIIHLAAIAANIMGKKVAFEAIDIDKAALPGAFDTIMLFSVLHHTKDVKASAAKVASACTRIVIECRLVERGSKPEGGEWHKTSTWSNTSVADLIVMLEGYFPGFRSYRNHGQVDKGRYLLELRRDSPASRH